MSHYNLEREIMLRNHVNFQNGDVHYLNVREDNGKIKGLCLIKSTPEDIPTEPRDVYKGAIMLYVGTTTDTYKNNTFYIYTNTEEKSNVWVELGSIGGEGIKTADTLPTATKDNLGSVYLSKGIYYQCSLKKDTTDEYEFAKIGYMDTWVGEDSDGTLKPLIDKNKLGELKNVELTDEVKEKEVLTYNGANWINSSNVFEKGTTTKVAVGGIAKNADIGEKTPLEILQLMLAGSLDSEKLSLNEIQQVYAKGTTVDSIAITATCRSEDENLAYVVFYKGDTEVYRESLSGSFAEVEYTYENISDDVELKVVLTTVSGLTSEGSRKISFVYASYYGKVGDTTFDEILSQTRAAIINYNYSGMVQPIYKYPVSYGELTQITDESGNDDYFNSFARTSESIGGVDYYVYTKITASVHTNMKYWFK